MNTVRLYTLPDRDAANWRDADTTADGRVGIFGEGSKISYKIWKMSYDYNPAVGNGADCMERLNGMEQEMGNQVNHRKEEVFWILYQILVKSQTEV